ncbi:hypothetical protein CHLNCDRAFT_142788 [Chlorella variabilis]|uniref:Uncharacterized protein HYDEF n=1 Tax=Chlorella variabilis TaxID=554065 RepID=E1Z8R5_CHLVA|nr:hypothetical protein CHLNCDRAFT_142788 [Chlorella variabilis]EFN57384.1 hypothetical protein CHLNCDRAFT_142788 [Chlorella variabilis]|eukprot:XP_005849486.1 hypothetical protein CHLNCDRAFT_142788 [Chlorella variabilis]
MLGSSRALQAAAAAAVSMQKALPWENAVTAEEAVKVLGSFWGTTFAPGDVLDLSVDQMEGLLSATSTGAGSKVLDNALFAHAESVTGRFFGRDVYYRGIVEFSNVCENDCGYCGIRKHQRRARRYTMPRDEVVEVADWAFRHRLGTLMLQSGELNTPQRMKYLTDVVAAVKERTRALDAEQRLVDPEALPKDAAGVGLCVALSVGELPREQYQQLKDAGADRYLLRIESSNPQLYASIHPPAQARASGPARFHKWENRTRCLRDLKDIGFMIGTGVMVGLPGQTLRDLAGDIMFFRDLGADMIGMGPYITEAGTPVADMWEQQFGHVDKKKHMQDMLTLTTRMNALARITLGNVNIAATTALQAIDAVGREVALRRGANVLMPILTPTKYREHYTLYEGKPCITDTAEECQKCLNARLAMVDKKLKPGVWGDPPSFRDSVHPVPMQAQAAAAASATGGSRGLRTWAPVSAAAARDGGLHTCSATGQQAAAAPAPGRGAVLGMGGGPAKGSDVPRTNIGIFGCMNAGKSSLMNRVTRSETSIVDSTPGTTADTKVVLMELHDVGPAKLFDTAGIDEEGALGEKKRRKVLSVIKETDVAVVVVDVGRFLDTPADRLPAALAWERLLLDKAAAAGSSPVLVYNTKLGGAGAGAGPEAAAAAVDRLQAALNPTGAIMSRQLQLSREEASDALAEFLQEAAAAAKQHDAPRSLPDEFLSEDAMVFLNIPMDAETPSMRLLRPQALVQEEAIRHFASTIAYRMNLAHARSSDPELVQRERARFLRALQPVLAHQGPKIIITDSQARRAGSGRPCGTAVDILHPWTLDPATGDELVPFTTFSIAMIHRQSRGQLPLFVRGLERFKSLRAGDKVLVAEACNHNRITDICNDIGMVQIPEKIEAQGGRGVVVDHAFGREFPELDAEEHCVNAVLQEAGVPVTNYGLLLSYAHSPAALERAMKPWGLRM